MFTKNEMVDQKLYCCNNDNCTKNLNTITCSNGNWTDTESSCNGGCPQAKRSITISSLTACTSKQTCVDDEQYVNTVCHADNLTAEDFAEFYCGGKASNVKICSIPVDIPRGKYNFHQCFNNIDPGNSVLCLNRADLEEKLDKKSRRSSLTNSKKEVSFCSNFVASSDFQHLNWRQNYYKSFCSNFVAISRSELATKLLQVIL